MKSLLSLGWSLMLVAIAAVSFTACDDEENLSSENDILTFTFPAANPAINTTIAANAITATVPYNQDVTQLTPTITISERASVQPASGIPQNFTNPVTYTVTAEDGSTKVYTVTITKEAAPVLVVTPVWQKNLNANGFPTWFTANNDRDIAVFGNNVYVHNNNDRIRVMSATDGADVTAGASGYIDGRQNFSAGNIFLLGTAVDNQGKIIASNLRVGTNPPTNWNVYKWNDKDAAQELLFAYPTGTGLRLGDNIDVVGDVAANASVFAPAAGATSTKILKFNIAAGTPNTTPVEITLQGITGLGNAADVALVGDASSNMIVVGTGVGNIAEYTQAGVLVGKLPDALKDVDIVKLAFQALSVDAFTVAGRKIVAATAVNYTATSDVGYLFLIDYTDGWSNVTAANIKSIPFTPPGNVDKNVNATGGVGTVVAANGNSATVYAMLTNFGVGAYTVTVD